MTRATDNNLIAVYLRGFIANVTRAPLVASVILLCLILYPVVEFKGPGALNQWFMPETMDLAQIWRVFTPVFVHYTFLHCATNLYLWWLLGVKLELAGRWNFVLLTLAAAAVGNIGQWYVSGPNFGGLSGVVYALFGYSWVVGRFGRRPDWVPEKNLSILMLLLIPICASGYFGKFADVAHVAGLLTGLVLGVFVVRASIRTAIQS